jgi:hypothetical protein
MTRIKYKLIRLISGGYDQMFDNLHKINFIASVPFATGLPEVQITFGCVIKLSENTVV